MQLYEPHCALTGTSVRSTVMKKGDEVEQQGITMLLQQMHDLH